MEGKPRKEIILYYQRSSEAHRRTRWKEKQRRSKLHRRAKMLVIHHEYIVEGEPRETNQTKADCYM
jgi:hypothetical protein